MITEQLFYWLISGLFMVIGFMMVWIIRSIVNDHKETKQEVIILRNSHHDLKVDHAKISQSVESLVRVVESNEKRDSKRFQLMEDILHEIKHKLK
jgi:hypothetical protein